MDSSTLRVGDTVPDFSLESINIGETVSLKSLVQQGPVILEFLRGTWCPNCVKRMAQFEPAKSQIVGLGASLVFIAAEKRGGMFKPEEFLAKHPISFPFLLDQDRAVTKAYGVYQRLGVDAINIARPATFVVDQAGVIRYIYVGSNQTDRAPVAEILSAVSNLHSEAG